MKRLPHVISEEEWRLLADQPSRVAPTGKRNLAILHAMYFAGLRVSESCNLSPRDLNHKTQTLRVRNGKGGRDRANLGVPAETWAVLERWAEVRPSSRYFFSTLSGNRLMERYIQAMVRRYADRSGVMKPTRAAAPAPIHPHVLRHSYATRLIDRGVPIHDVARALGRASIGTTARYLHVNDEKLADRLRHALDEDAADDALSRRIREELQTLLHA